MSRVDVVMPQMGESIVEGTVSKWLKKVGEEVKRDEAILEISTDKVDAEIPSPVAGVLAEIKVEAGATVEVQTVIAVIETEKGAAARPPEPEKPTEDHVAAVPTAPAPVAVAPGGPVDATQAVAVEPNTPVGDGGSETAEDRLRRRSTPLVRKIAAEHQVAIETIAGTGHSGRVTKKDIMLFLEGRASTASGAVVQSSSRSVELPRKDGGEIVHPTVEPWPGDRVEPMTRIRKLTADHMVLSRRVSAHVTSFYEVDFSAIAQIRQAKKDDYLQRGARLTFLAFIVNVLSSNLRKHAILNASVSGDNIIYRQPINVGIAVALDWGLIVPVLKNADDLSLMGIAKRMADLGERARTKRLSPDEVQHGTFTITNPGGFGSYVGAPIISQPQVAIMGVGAIEKRPKVITLDDGQDVIAIRTLGMLSLSYDHRVVDGADADRFMADVKRDLEQFTVGAE